MAGSLREQLIAAGLATSGQAKKAERQVKAEKQAQGKPKPDRKPAADTAQKTPPKPKVLSEAEKRYAAKVERDRELARIANEKAATKARRAEIKQILAQNDQRTAPASDDDVPYNFLHGKKIKRIYVTRDHQAKLSAGTLLIANNDGRYHLVTPEVAEQIRARDPHRIMSKTDEKTGDKTAEPSADDEYYAKFKVPDDLDW